MRRDPEFRRDPRAAGGQLHPVHRRPLKGIHHQLSLASAPAGQQKAAQPRHTAKLKEGKAGDGFQKKHGGSSGKDSLRKAASEVPGQ